MLRFLSVLGILLLLLAPIIKNFITETQKPLIVIAEDKSQSITLSTPSETLEAVDNNLEALKSNLEENFDIVNINFSDDLAFADSDSIDNQTSNLSKPLEFISESYQDQNLGAIIYATDGIYNEGKNPLYSNIKTSAPLYTIPLGDTTVRRDIIVKNVLHNRIVYLNDRFSIEVDVQAYNSAGAKTDLSLYRSSNGQRQKINTQPISIDKNNFFKTFNFELDADQVGNNKYEVIVNNIPNEISTANNRRSVYIETLDARQKILLLAANTHPDIKAIKQIIDSNKNYEIEIKKAGDPATNIAGFDIIILHNLPNQKFDISNYLSDAKRLKKPLFFIVGAATNISQFNSAQNVINITGGNQSMNDVTALLKNSFTLFTLSDDFKSTIGKLVPLKVPFGEFKPNATSKILLEQKIGNVETAFPLLAYNDDNSHKQAVLSGEGLWRWRLMEFTDYPEQPFTKEIFLKTLQYISQKEDKRQFRAFANKNVYKENENILLDAQLYNENYEMVNIPEAFINITNSEGEKFEYTFSKNNNYYFIDAGRFPEGNYNFTATTNFNGKNLSASGRFNVQSIIKEQYDLTAKHDLLFELSEKMGGQMVYPQDLGNLATLINNNDQIKPILYQKAQSKSLLDYKWLMAIILLLLALEWFLRRYFGGY